VQHSKLLINGLARMSIVHKCSDRWQSHDNRSHNHQAREDSAESVQVRAQASTFYESVPFTAETLQDLFSSRRDTSELAVDYEEAISMQIDEHERTKGLLGACLIEPIMQGAGGMLFVDPLFQKTLVKVYIGLGLTLQPERSLHCASYVLDLFDICSKVFYLHASKFIVDK
jgi:hypothetical protein